MSLIAARGLSVAHSGLPVLRDVDLEIERGEIVTVVGPNGAGKTTLLKALLGAVKPDGGRVERAPGLTIGYVPQKLQVDRSMPMTVRRFLDLPRRASEAEAQAALERVGAAALAKRQMADLSGGQFQRVLLARALLLKPDLLILDEATQGLDPQGSAGFYRLVLDLRDALGCAVLMVSHELHVVLRATDRVICLNGHVCCEGAPDAVRSDPEYRALFGAGADVLAIYRHDHDHSHDGPGGACRHDPGPVPVPGQTAER